VSAKPYFQLTERIWAWFVLR